jgi:hypothetical protein
MNKLLLFFMLLLPLAVVSCEDAGDGSLILGKDMPVEVTASVSEMNTKAGYEGTTVLPEKFYIDIRQNQDSKYDYSLVEMVRKQGDGNRYSVKDEMTLLWAEPDRTGVGVKALTLPFGRTALDPSNAMMVSVAPDQSLAESVKDSDLLGADNAQLGGVDINGNSVNIAFKHLLAKLDVSYVYGAELSGSDVVVNSIALKNVCVSRGYSYADMDFDDSAACVYGDVMMCHDSDARQAEAIFMPYVVDKNPSLVLKATIDGVQHTFTCPVVAKDAAGFVSGCRYTLRITITGSSISNTMASITQGWDDATDGNTFVTE